MALELLILLLHKPTDDSVEVAISFLRECGEMLSRVSRKGINSVFDNLREILHQGSIDKRVCYCTLPLFNLHSY